RGLLGSQWSLGWVLGVGPRWGRGSGVGASVPAELVEALVVDAEVVRDLVDDRHRDLVDDLLTRVADRERGLAEDRDAVGQRAGGPPVVALGQGDALVEAEEVVRLAGRRAVLDEHDDVV